MDNRPSPPPPNKSTPDEVARLARVYKNYQVENLRERKWRPDNAGNRAIFAERDRKVRESLAGANLWPPQQRTILDVGCGAGEVLAGLRQSGATAAQLYGVDLLPERVIAARRNFPELTFEVANAEQLPFETDRFDLVLLFTVFSSILDPAMAGNVAREVDRVLVPSGAILWYDLRHDNPRNPHVRGMSRTAVHHLFPGYTGRWRSLTLIPPLARRLGRLTPRLYPLLAAIPPLRTHLLALLNAPNRA